MSNYSFSILRSRNFRFLLLARIATIIAWQAQAIIVGWQIYSLTKDPLMLGLIGLTEALPAIFCALFAGYIVDISRPKTIYLASLGVLTLNALFLLLIGGNHIDLAHHHLVISLFGGVFVAGLVRGFIAPAAFSVVPQIVPRQHIPAASSWLTSGFQFATICGPASAGLIYGGYGPAGAWLMPFILLIVALTLIAFLEVPPKKEKPLKRDSAAKSIKAGWDFILKNPVLLSVMTLDMFAVLFGGAVAMLPAYADQILHVGSEGLGALRAAPALGAVIMAVYLAVRPMKRLSAKMLMTVIVGFGICMIGFGLSKIFWLSMFFLALSGAFDSVSMVIRSTIMQLLTPEDMRGRVSSVNSMFIISSNEIGAFESGLAARYLGLVPSVVFGGFATLCVVAIVALGSPKFRKTIVVADDS